MAELRLLTGGQVYGGWQGIRVRRGMDQLCGSFELAVTELWPGQDFTRRIQPGESCSVQIDGAAVVTGYVDQVEMQIDAGNHTVSVTGRDKTADLVDCSAVRGTSQWRGQRIEQIARDLCVPFGVLVRAEVDTGKPLASFALQEGESVFDALDRLARLRALLLTTDGLGALVITRAGVRRVATELVLGVNVLEASASLDMKDRFSSYTIKGQAAGNDFFNGRAASQIKAVATDPLVPRHRPLVLSGEHQDAAASLQQRAQWEANVRAARSTDISVTVQGWAHEDGLWEPNTLVRMRAAELRIDDELLVKSVAYSLNEGGTKAELQLTRADAFTLLPIKPAAAGAASAGFWHLPKPEAVR